jgi:small subunit ribosomal protein S16
MSRYGRKKIPFYRIVVCERAGARDGRFIEWVGTVDPAKDPAELKIKEDRIRYWVGVGAKPSKTVFELLEKEIPGFLSGIETDRTKKIQKTRAKRKVKAKSTAKPKVSAGKAKRKESKKKKAAAKAA